VVAQAPRYRPNFGELLPSVLVLGDLTVKSFEPRMVCTKCGTIGADVRPNWKERA
jgi:hypothetical protein